jgi:hypothetical protein
MRHTLGADMRSLVKHDQSEAALVEYAFDRNVLLSGHKYVQRTF